MATRTDVLAGLLTGACLFSATMAHAQIPRRDADFEMVARIGTISGQPQYEFGRINAAALLPNGTVAVSDLLAREVRLFDAAGRHLRTVGGEGSGPGEFQAPARITVLPDEFVVYDAFLQRSSRFSFDGEYRGTISPDPAGIVHTPVAFGAHGLWISHWSGGMSSGDVPRLRQDPQWVPPRMMEHLMVGRVGSARVDTLLSSRGGNIYFIDGRAFSGLSASFGRGISWALDGDSILAVVDGINAIVTLYRVTPDRLERTRELRLGLPVQPVREADVRRIEAQTRAAGFNLTRNAILLTPPAAAQVGGPKFDGDGNLWLARSDITSEQVLTGTYFIVPRAGPVFQIQGPRGVALHSVRDGRIAGSVLDEFDVNYLQIYRYSIR